MCQLLYYSMYMYSISPEYIYIYAHQSVSAINFDISERGRERERANERQSAVKRGGNRLRAADNFRQTFPRLLARAVSRGTWGGGRIRKRGPYPRVWNGPCCRSNGPGLHTSRPHHPPPPIPPNGTCYPHIGAAHNHCAASLLVTIALLSPSPTARDKRAYVHKCRTRPPLYTPRPPKQYTSVTVVVIFDRRRGS